ncbi:hypothetical protein P8452_12988 [Trifolium repens]|nr:hypothetical protein P8452_12988 [Trifolium repens]
MTSRLWLALFLEHGAALSVVWGHVSEEVAHAAKEDITAVKDELHKYQIKRWHAIGTLKHALSFAVTMVIMYAPDPDLRKNSFAVLKGVLADVPISERLDVFKALIRNANSSSMIAILLDLVRKEMHTEIHSSTSVVKGVQQINHEAHPDISFWSPSVLELVESVLRPPQGGPPSLPEQSDAAFFLFHSVVSSQPIQICIVDRIYRIDELHWSLVEEQFTQGLQ